MNMKQWIATTPLEILILISFQIDTNYGKLCSEDYLRRACSWRDHVESI